jgi:hypothetical protein
VDKGDLTPDAEAHERLRGILIGLVGDWKNADSARRESAVENAQHVYDEGYAKQRLKAIYKREDTIEKIKQAKEESGVISSKRKARTEKEEKDRKWYNGPKTGIYGLFDFSQLMHDVFGEKSAVAEEVLAAERLASNLKEDSIQAKMEDVDDLFREISGGSEFIGMKLRYDLSQRTIDTDFGKFSQMEGLDVVMTWRQNDGQRHMIGQLGENAEPVGGWHYDQAFVDSIEAKLTPAARRALDFLTEKYDAEYDRLNKIYRALNDVDLPRHAFYAPISVTPVNAGGQGLVDPSTGQSMGSSIAPSSLKTRGHSIAEPKFIDALQKYIAHTKQMEHYIAYAPFLDKLNAVMKSRDFLNVVEAKSGQQAKMAMVSWLNIFRDGGVNDATNQLALNKMANKMLSNAAGAILAGRLSVLAVQSTQLGAALAEMPTASYLKRLGLLTTGQLDFRDAYNSAYIQRRLNVLPPAVRLAMQGLLAGKPNQIKFAQQKMLGVIGGADAFFTAGTFAMIYDYELSVATDAGMGEAEAKAHALEQAEIKTDRVAQPTRLAQRSLYENSLTNPLAKMGFMFASESRQKLALAMWAVASKDMPLGRRLRGIATTWLVGGMIATLIRAASRDAKSPEDDDEKIWGTKHLLFSALTGPLQGIPLISDVLEGSAAALTGEPVFDGSFASNIIQGVKGGKHLALNWEENDAGETMRDLDGIIGAFGVLNETASGASSLTHLARDVFSVGNQVINAESE